MIFLGKLRTGLIRLSELTQDSLTALIHDSSGDRDSERFLDLERMGITTYESKDVKSSVYSYFCGRQKVLFYFTREEKEEIVSTLENYYQDNGTETLNQANFILDHKMKIFGSTRYDLGKNIDWSLDFASGERWPLSYYKNIKMYRHDGRRDVLYTAKINRHQHLTTLARAYLYSKNSIYCEEGINQITDWIDKNPYKRGINWWSALVVSQRALSWIWFLSLVGFRTIGQEKFWVILKSLYLHAKFIEQNLSLDSEYPNNHLIGEATSLTILGLFFPEFHGAEGWKQRGLEILESQLSHQFYESGAHKEQSFSYHLFVTELYTHVFILCRRNQIDSQLFSKRLERMYEFIMKVCMPDGTAPTWGDSSELTGVNLSDQPDRPLEAFFSIGSVLFNRPDMRRLSGRFSEEALWLCTAEGRYRFERMEEARPQYSSIACQDVGIFAMRDGWQQTSRYMAADCGSQGLGRAGHGHADMLSFQLWANGECLIVDPGTYTYNGPYEWRQYFRGSLAHNTVVVDGLDQAEPKPPDRFAWNKLAHPRLNSWYCSQGFDYLEGEHDGYERLAQPVTHQRRILFLKGEYWIVSDILMGRGKHKFDCLFHFPPGKVRLAVTDRTLTTCFPRSNIKVVPLDQGLEAAVIEGSEDPIQGWISREYGSKVAAPVLQYTKQSKPPVFFDVLLYPFLGSDSPSIRIEEVVVYNEKGEVMDQLETRCLKICIGEMEDYYLSSMKNQGVKRFENFVTDGKVIHFRKVDNKVIRSQIMEGTFASYENHLL